MQLAIRFDGDYVMFTRHVGAIRWPERLGGIPRALALAAALYFAVLALRMLDPVATDAEGTLYVLPISVLALRYGLRGGVIGGLVALALVVAWDLTTPREGLSAIAYLDRGVAFATLGALVGLTVDRRRRAETALSSYYDASLDLLATADLNGTFLRVNQAWERTLGHSAATICSRPFAEFVHPDDVQRTIAETAALIDGTRHSVGFRNRYRTADGNWRWLEWNASLSPSGDEIYAVARDVTTQRRAERQLATSSRRLQERIAERTYELEHARNETLRLLALAAEYRDDDTPQHTERVAVMSVEIARHLGLDAERIRHLRDAATLHDVGKIAIPDHILLNPGTLTAEEAEIMKTHAALGARLLYGTGSPVLQMAASVAATHHEWWNGGGYPVGLAGERIPITGRIVAVADVFDALTHDRPYKPAWPVSQAVARIERGAGTQFDPSVVAAFLVVREGVLASVDGESPRRQPWWLSSRPTHRGRPAPESSRQPARLS